MLTSELLPPRALIADDQPDVLEALRLLLKAEGIQTEAVTSPDAALEAIKSRDFDLLLMDLNYARDTTSGLEGMDLLSRVGALDDSLPVVVMTAWGSIELAIESMRHGVRDFVLKPWENDQLVATLRAQIDRGRTERDVRRVARERQRELDEARRIQQRLLPTVIPQPPGLEIAAAWQPALGVGGDYFDVLKLDDGGVALCIADVSGKGMPAALLMSNVQAAVRSFALESIDPAQLCAKVNRVVSGNTAADRFISFFYCKLDARAGRLVYSNAGHNPPLLARADTTVVRLDRGGSVLGPIEQATYDEESIDFKPGDRLLLFTDGVTEARDASGEEFGEERLIDLLVENAALDAQRLAGEIILRVTQFSGAAFHDDLTLIAVSAR